MELRPNSEDLSVEIQLPLRWQAGRAWRWKHLRLFPSLP